MKRKKSAREIDAEFRMYERNPLKCFTCSEPLAANRSYSYVGGYPVCLICQRLSKSIGKAIGI